MIWRSTFFITDLIFLMAVELVRFFISWIGSGKLYFSKNFPSYLNFQVYWHKIIYAMLLPFNSLVLIAPFSFFKNNDLCFLSFLLVLPKIINVISVFKEPAFSFLSLSISLMFSISINTVSYLFFYFGQFLKIFIYYFFQW